MRIADSSLGLKPRLESAFPVGVNMRTITSFKFAGFTIFLLFFGVAVLEAFQSHNWIKGALWLAFGAVFLFADNLRKPA